MNPKNLPDYDFKRIAAAINFIRNNFKSQPDLETVAEHVHLSPSHFQRIFTEWAGVSPKMFQKYLSLEYAKSLISANNKSTLFDITLATGLSSSSRLHDLFVTIEAMTPASYKNGGKGLTIEYNLGETPFGQAILGSTTIGICHIAFEDNLSTAIQNLQAKFPEAVLVPNESQHHLAALSVLGKHIGNPDAPIKLHLKGTPFQIKVWEALLRIPFGELSTYGGLANQIGNSAASRAVGTAIGSNPVAYLIPCHRVIQSSGALGGYMWGTERKAAMIGWEGVNSYEMKR